MSLIKSIIVAVGNDNQIGYNNNLLWKISDDLKNFKKITLNHSILMGRKTFESIGKPLKNRKNVIITSNSDYKIDSCYVFDDIEKALDFAKDEEEIFICGGEQIYKYFLENNLVDRIYLTKVNYDGVADRYFPKINENEWNIEKIFDFEKNEANEYSGSFFIYNKK